MNRAIVAAISLLMLVSSVRPVAQAGTIGFSEMVLRVFAVRAPMPVYPAESLSRGVSGVVVISLATDAAGRVSTVAVLQAPDAAIGAAVDRAVREWTFSPAQISGRAEQSGVRGKLTFYFRIEGGRGRVLNPQDIPGGPKLPPGPPPSAGPGVRAGGPPAPPGQARSAPPARPAVVVDHGVDASIEIGDAELRQLQRPLVLDLRERGEFARAHRDDAVNIPRDELVARAGIELDRARPIVIDCSRMETRDCHSAARTLRANSLGFARVFVYLP
jgi:TonB family protein